MTRSERRKFKRALKNQLQNHRILSLRQRAVTAVKLYKEREQKIQQLKQTLKRGCRPESARKKLETELNQLLGNSFILNEPVRLRIKRKLSDS